MLKFFLEKGWLWRLYFVNKFSVKSIYEFFSKFGQGMRYEIIFYYFSPCLITWRKMQSLLNLLDGNWTLNKDWPKTQSQNSIWTLSILVYKKKLHYLVLNYYILTHKAVADPQSLPVVIIVFTQVFRTYVRAYVPTFQNLENNFKVKTMFSTGENVGLAEWIIDETLLVHFIYFCYLGNHQFVTGKIFHQGPESQANENYLQDVQRVQEQPATARFSSPQTSSQEIGWFTKYVPSTGYDSQETVKKPIVHSELSQYMSTYWKYYPSNNNLLRGASNPKTVAQNKWIIIFWKPLVTSFNHGWT